MLNHEQIKKLSCFIKYMKIYTKDEFYSNKSKILKDIINGAVFIYPTDTIYGIGCDARNPKSVNRIYKLKETREKPFSVIAPSKEWITKNCDVNGHFSKSWIKKLPGPYTLILILRNNKCISENANLGKTTIGVRIPNHWISEIVKELGFPLVTTSANKTGKEFMTNLENLDPCIKENVDFIIYEDEKQNRPSSIIDLSRDNIAISER